MCVACDVPGHRSQRSWENFVNSTTNCAMVGTSFITRCAAMLSNGTFKHFKSHPQMLHGVELGPDWSGAVIALEIGWRSPRNLAVANV